MILQNRSLILSYKEQESHRDFTACAGFALILNQARLIVSISRFFSAQWDYWELKESLLLLFRAQQRNPPPLTFLSALRIPSRQEPARCPEQTETNPSLGMAAEKILTPCPPSTTWMRSPWHSEVCVSA